MMASGVKTELSNLEIHMGNFKDKKFKFKCDVTYEDLLLKMDGGRIVVRLHARNIGNMHLEKKAVRISALNFEIEENEEVSVASGSIKVEFGAESEAWYKELWG